MQCPFKGEMSLCQILTASFWQEGNWFVAQCLDVDVASQGETEAEALANLREALELYVEPPRPMIKPIIRQFEVERLSEHANYWSDLVGKYCRKAGG